MRIRAFLQNTFLKLRYDLLNAFTGLVAGLFATVGFNYIWQEVIPIEAEEAMRSGPFHLRVLVVILLAVALPAIAGGIIGGRIPREGGIKNQLILAAVFGLLFVLPFACFIFWYIQW